MGCKISIELVANSGVYIRCNDTTILIDGIYGKNPCFTQPTKEMGKSVLGIKSKYTNVDYILFTHRHVDHFSGMFLEKYLINNKVKKVFIPESSLNEKESDAFNTNIYGKIVQELNIPFGEELQESLGGNNFFTCFRSVHMGGKQYNDTIHYTYILTLEGKNFLFAGDADTIEGNLVPSSGPLKFEAAFVNALFFQNKKGEKLFDEVLKPISAVIYHLPFEADDITGLRKLANRQLVKRQHKSYEIVLFQNEEQILFF